MREKLIDFWENEKIENFVKENKEMLIKVAATALLVAAAFFVFIFTRDVEEESLVQDKELVTESEPIVALIMVDIGGEVEHPMVVELEQGSRVEDAIIAAGGVTADADLTEINRAAFIEDGDKILIPTKIDENTVNTEAETTVPITDSRININTAGSEDLQKLDGIGPVTAEKIIEYREENGGFKNIEDLKNVSGIGEKTFEKLKSDIRT